MTTRQSPFRSDLLQGKVALVTGGATGLGLEIARVPGVDRAAGHVALPPGVCSRMNSAASSSARKASQSATGGGYSRPYGRTGLTYRTVAWVVPGTEQSHMRKGAGHGQGYDIRGAR